MATPKISEDIQAVLDSLKANNFDARFAPTAVAAKEMMLAMILPDAAVGVGDSVTLRETGVLEELERRGNKVVNPFTPEMTRDRGPFRRACRLALQADVFITGSNAVTRDGKIINIDRSGNRVAGIIYGAEKIILAVGRNKIVRDADEALWRIKNVLAPFHAGHKGLKTPCAKTGKCSDCRTAERICNVTVVLEKRPSQAGLSVIIIDEDLGLGWDPAWDEGRINEIKSAYRRNTWKFFAPPR